MTDQKSNTLPAEGWKDSGIDWIGEIPNEWGVTLIKRVLKIPITDGPHTTPEILDSGVPFISAESIKNEKINFNKKRGFISNEDHLEFSKKYSPIKGDIFMVKSGATTGRIAMVETDEDFSIWSPLAVFRANKSLFDERFLFQYMRSIAFQQSVEVSWSFGTQQNIGMGVLSNLSIIVPPLDIQKSIATFLDEKTALIDELIAKKERMIELLEEQRQATINHAVTKGLDPNLPMKDSGIEWIGEIPEDWELLKVKNACYVKGRIGWQNLRNEDFTDIGPYCVTGTDFKNGLIDWTNCYHVTHDRYLLDDKITLMNDDVLITKDGSIGKIAIVKDLKDKATLNSGIFVTRPEDNSYHPDYFFWVLNSNVFTRFIDFNKSGATIQHLYQNVFENFVFPSPRIDDQKKIVDHLIDVNNEFERLTLNTFKELELLKEYKSSLIFNAVTGKLPIHG